MINGDPRWAQVRRLAFFNPMKMSFRFLLLKVPKDEKRGWKWVIIMIGWFYSVSWVWRLRLVLPQWVMRRVALR